MSQFKFFKKFNKPPLVEFFSSMPGLETIEECLPKPTRHFIPEWWKAVPTDSRKQGSQVFETPTVKMCPSFPDYFSQGYVIPMWADTVLSYNEQTNSWTTQIGLSQPTNPFSVEVHSNEQFINYVRPSLLGSTGNFIFKFNCPWRVRTPKGYSLLQLPMFYHFNSEFSVLPGVVHTDFHHDVNQQVVYYGNGSTVFIPRGTPLAQYIPFKRTKFSNEIRYATESDKYLILGKAVEMNTKFSGAYRARKAQEKSI